MFDTIINKNCPSKLEVKVNEFKAPTDDSIRLYKEIEQKVWNSITDRVTFECSNTFKGELLIYDKMQMFSYSCRLIAELNGRKISTTFHIDRTYDKNSNYLIEQIKKLQDKIDELEFINKTDRYNQQLQEQVEDLQYKVAVLSVK